MAMSKEEVLETLDEVRRYLTAGNPVWDTDKIEEALRTAQEALEEMPETVLVKKHD